MPTSHANQPLDPGVRRQIMTVLFIGVFMSALDAAVIAPAIPALRDAFGVANSQIGMVTIAYSMGALISTGLMASLSDLYGRRPVYLLNVTGFALSSLLIALSPSFWIVVLFRFTQGFFAGGINPIASAIIGDSFPPEERGRALGMIGATFGMAFLIGPLLASVVLVAVGWPWIFLLNLPVAVVVIGLGLRNLPRRQAVGTMPPFDWVGVLILAVMLSSLTLGINQVIDKLTGLSLWPYLLGISVIALPLLLVVESRAARPIVPLKLFTTRQLALTYALCVGAGFGMGSIMFITTVAVDAFGIAARQAGFLLIPMIIFSSLGSVVSGRMLNQVGSRLVVLAGFGATLIGMLMLALLSTNFWIYITSTLLIGVGVGVVVGGVLRTIVLNEVSATERAAAQGLVNIGIAIGNLLVVAMISALADTAEGLIGLSRAYLAAAAVMVLMVIIGIGLKARGSEQATAVSAARAD